MQKSWIRKKAPNKSKTMKISNGVDNSLRLIQRKRYNFEIAAVALEKNGTKIEMGSNVKNLLVNLT